MAVEHVAQLAHHDAKCTDGVVAVDDLLELTHQALVTGHHAPLSTGVDITVDS